MFKRKITSHGEEIKILKFANDILFFTGNEQDLEKSIKYTEK